MMFKKFRPQSLPKPPALCLFCDEPGTTDIRIGHFRVQCCGEHIDLALDTYNAARREKK